MVFVTLEEDRGTKREKETETMEQNLEWVHHYSVYEAAFSKCHRMEDML